MGSSGGSGVSRRARLDPEERRAQIIDAAYGRLEAGGVEAMAIEEVADAAGVSRSLVYAYFGDRDTLIAEIYLRVLQQIDDEMPSDLGTGIPDDLAAVRDMVTVCLTFARAHPSAWQLLVTDSVRRHPMVAAAREERILRFTDGTAGAGSQLVAEAAWGLLEAGVLHWLGQDDLPVEVAAEMLATTLWSGLGQIRSSGSTGSPDSTPT